MSFRETTIGVVLFVSVLLPVFGAFAGYGAYLAARDASTRRFMMAMVLLASAAVLSQALWIILALVAVFA